MAGNGGEARRRRAAMDRGAPVPHQKECPVRKCRGKRVRRCGPDSSLARLIAKAWGNKASTAIDMCPDCGNFWEPWPDDDPGDLYRDDVDREPCDNCAYRAGSRESQDPQEWARLQSIAKKAAAAGFDEPGRPWFVCHKGVPIRLNNGHIEFAYELVDRRPYVQSCAGFLRVLWHHNGASKQAPNERERKGPPCLPS